MMTNEPLLSSFCHMDGRKGKDGQRTRRHIFLCILRKTTYDDGRVLDFWHKGKIVIYLTCLF